MASSAKRDRRRTPPPDPQPVGALVDAHTHLAACGGRDPESVRAILDHAAAVGVGRVVTVADDMVDARWAVAAAEWDARVWAATALHPTHAGDLDDAAKAELTEMAQHPRVVAVGETGLDYYWPGLRDGVAAPDVQREAFAWHIDLAKRAGKTLMIHCRDADGTTPGAAGSAYRDVLDVLAAEGAPETVVFHCFSGDAAVAREAVGLGYILSFSGTVSFTTNTALHEAARLVPDAQLLVETDAPYLTPHPHRGRPNQSYCLPYTAAALAELRGVDAAGLADTLTANAERVFGLAVPPQMSV